MGHSRRGGDWYWWTGIVRGRDGEVTFGVSGAGRVLGAWTRRWVVRYYTSGGGGRKGHYDVRKWLEQHVGVKLAWSDRAAFEWLTKLLLCRGVESGTCH